MHSESNHSYRICFCGQCLNCQKSHINLTSQWGQIEKKWILQRVNSAFLFSVLFCRKQQRAGQLGNNCAGRGPRLPSTTMVRIISQLWGWLELRSSPFMSTEAHLLLGTLALLLTSCHHQQLHIQQRRLFQAPNLTIWSFKKIFFYSLNIQLVGTSLFEFKWFHFLSQNHYSWTEKELDSAFFFGLVRVCRSWTLFKNT